MADHVSDPPCWCGEVLGEAIGDSYRVCPACGTAALATTLDDRHFTVTADEHDFYGRRYWLEFQRERGLPDIVERAPADLAGRCLQWLEAVLELVRPPGRVLEIGCGHGGFVGLLGELGFDAMGTELSPWVGEFARATFGVRVEIGPIETLPIEPGFLAVCAFDVLEHVRDPLSLVRRAGELLSPDGVLYLQTPCYRGQGSSWEMFQEREHVFLFSEAAIRRLLEAAGFRAITVGPALFPYDMWVTAGREKLPARWPDISTWPGLPAWGRAVRTLRDQLARTEEGRREAEVDRAARLVRIETLAERLEGAEADRAARLMQIETLTERLKEAEADRAARLVQIETLTAWLREGEAKRTAQLEEMARLRAQVEAIHGSWAWRVYRFLRGRGGSHA